MKSLLDHIAYRWIVHRPDLSFMKKQAVIINTAAGGGMRSTVRDIKDSTENLGFARTHCISQSVWDYTWNNLPESFQKSIHRKVTRTARNVRHCARHLTPSLKVWCVFTLYRFLHKHQKMSTVDDAYWQDHGLQHRVALEKQKSTIITETLFVFLPLRSALPPHQTRRADSFPSTLFLFFPVS